MKDDNVASDVNKSCSLDELRWCLARFDGMTVLKKPVTRPGFAVGLYSRMIGMLGWAD